MALSAARATVRDDDTVIPRIIALPQKGSTTIYAGALVVLNAGYAAPGSTATGLKVVGRAEETKTNAGSDGANTVKVRQGTFKWANSGTDAVVAADVGALCYIEDDQTVSHTSTGKSIAGRVVRLDSDGVVVTSYIGAA